MRPADGKFSDEGAGHWRRGLYRIEFYPLCSFAAERPRTVLYLRVFASQECSLESVWFALSPHIVSLRALNSFCWKLTRPSNLCKLSGLRLTWVVEGSAGRPGQIPHRFPKRFRPRDLRVSGQGRRTYKVQETRLEQRECLEGYTKPTLCQLPLVERQEISHCRRKRSE
jgi:hypothetical protein